MSNQNQMGQDQKNQQSDNAGRYAKNPNEKQDTKEGKSRDDQEPTRAEQR